MHDPDTETVAIQSRTVSLASFDFMQGIETSTSSLKCRPSLDQISLKWMMQNDHRNKRMSSSYLAYIFKTNLSRIASQPQINHYHTPDVCHSLSSVQWDDSACKLTLDSRSWAYRLDSTGHRFPPRSHTAIYICASRCCNHSSRCKARKQVGERPLLALAKVANLILFS